MKFLNIIFATLCLIWFGYEVLFGSSITSLICAGVFTILNVVEHSYEDLKATIEDRNIK